MPRDVGIALRGATEAASTLRKAETLASPGDVFGEGGTELAESSAASTCQSRTLAQLLQFPFGTKPIDLDLRSVLALGTNCWNPAGLREADDLNSR